MELVDSGHGLDDQRDRPTPPHRLDEAGVNLLLMVRPPTANPGPYRANTAGHSGVFVGLTWRSHFKPLTGWGSTTDIHYWSATR